MLTMPPRGFTLIETIVSVAIFAIVMTIALGSLLAMIESDRKAQTLKSVINNLNFSMDSMTRSIRTGEDYHCDAAVGTITAARDCGGVPATSFVYKPVVGNTTIYRLESSNAALCGQPAARVGCITRSTDNGVTYSAITSPEVYIQALKFYVTGAENPNLQPKVTVLIAGEVTVSASQKSPLNLQTSVTQRLYDR